MFTTAIRLLLFVFSNIGFWEILGRKTKINIYFLPSLTVAIQTTVLFWAGLLNVLLEATVIMYAFGTLCLIYYLFLDLSHKRGLSIVKKCINHGYIFLAVYSVILLLFLDGKMFTHIDNFTHWALVVKKMLLTDRMPNFNDTIIIFQEYPLGSALYIYFLSRVVGAYESVQMFAQAYMMLTFILPLFAFSKKNRIIGLVVIVFSTFFFLNYSALITELLVDTLLALAGACSLVYTYSYCRNLDNKFEFYAAGFYMTLLLQIKNSGVFFALIQALLIIMYIKEDKKLKERLLCSVLPFFSFIFWHTHCKYVYSSSAVSKHAMTVENYKNVFGEKTKEDIQLIASSVLKSSLSDKGMISCVIIIVLLGIIVFFLMPKHKQSFTRMVLACCLLYILYQIGVLGMYLFSMPVAVADLPGYSRYNGTIIISILYLIIVYIINMTSQMNIKPIFSLLTSIAIMIIFVGITQYSVGIDTLIARYTTTKIEDNTLLYDRVRMEDLKQEYFLLDGNSYTFIVDEGESEFLWYFTRYYFDTTEVEYIQTDDLNKLASNKADYLILCTKDNDKVERWMQENYPVEVGRSIIIPFD